MFIVQSSDRVIVTIGLNLLKAELEKANKLLEGVGLDPSYTAGRALEAAGLLDSPVGGPLAVPDAWLLTLRAALSLELARVAGVTKAQLALFIVSKDTQSRAAQLDRLLSEIDVARLGAEAAPA